jgi:Glycosyl hydrolases family 2, TIM barrel domain
VNGSLLSLASFVFVLGACSATPSGKWHDSEGFGSAPGVDGASAGTSNGGTGSSSSGASGALASGGTGASSGGSGAPPVTMPKPVSPTASWVYIDGYRLMVGKRASDGSLATPTPFKLKGVSWSPTGIGESNGNGNGYSKLYTSHAGTDVPLIAGLHANTVKTYDPFERTAQGTAVLDQLYAQGVMVVMQVMASKFTSATDAAASASYFKGHPAILAWMVGNEFNYNNLYGASNFEAALSQVNGAISAIHAADPDHPVLVSYGELPAADVYSRIPADIWSINLYPNLDLASRFVAWQKLSTKPMLVGEYGADAFNNNEGAEDQDSQASATTTLTTQITKNYSALALDGAHVVLGGTIYSLSDEWWKSGNANAHDNGGMNGNVFPDNFANEEWWGLTTVERQPRSAYTALATIYAAN